MLTTSRYASKETRVLARRMAAEKGERFFARGKRTVAQLVSLARRLGEKKIFVLEEKDGKPAGLAALSVSETGGWEWEKEHKP